jgi:hypothetical protein
METKTVAGYFFHAADTIAFNGTTEWVDLKPERRDHLGSCGSIDLPKNRKHYPRIRRDITERTGYNYLEIIFVIERSLHDGQTEHAKERFLQVFELMQTHYKRVDIHLLLLDMQFLHDDPFNLVEGDHNANLDKFTEWRRKQHTITDEKWDRTDNSILFLDDKYFGNPTVGLAWIGTMCELMSTAIVSDHRNQVGAVAATASHELGHNYGMNHDTVGNDASEDCYCEAGDQQCIMAGVVSWEIPNQWSKCSRNILREKLTDHGCLHDKPPPGFLFGDPNCGNGMLNYCISKSQ